MSLGNDYFLVSCSSDTDQITALTEEPWMIYDHNLTGGELCANCCPSNVVIDQLLVWVRVVGLPIEYYDGGVHSFIGNQIGKTIKVDINTLTGRKRKVCVNVRTS